MPISKILAASSLVLALTACGDRRVAVSLDAGSEDQGLREDSGTPTVDAGEEDSGAPDLGAPTSFYCDFRTLISCDVTQYCAEDARHAPNCYDLPSDCTDCECAKADAATNYAPASCLPSTCVQDEDGNIHINCST